MRARSVNSPGGTAAVGTGPALCSLVAAWAVLTASVLAIAGLTHLLWPRWLEDDPVLELPDRASLAIDIFTNNLLIAVTPLLGGWLAAGQLARGRRLLAIATIVLPSVVIVRSVVTIGVVGGGDIGWLVDASRWWLLEVAALAVAGRTLVWVVRHPPPRAQAGEAMTRALWIVIVLLGMAAVIEVFTA